MRLLARHGSREAHLGDGWGIAFHAGDDALVIKQAEPASDSAWVDFLENREIRSSVVISHIRRATQGEVSLRNTQPFSRELGGRAHVFAHNGKLPGIERYFAAALKRFHPIGTTDSEVGFCVLLERLAPIWDFGVPSPAQRAEIVSRLASELREFGPANFLYSDGDLLIAHGHRRTHSNGHIAPPGLVTITRSCLEETDQLEPAGVRLREAQLVTLFASVPLTDELWRPLAEGEVMVIRQGQPMEMSATEKLNFNGNVQQPSTGHSN